MTAREVMLQLEKLGHAPTKKTFLRHGCKAPMFGVKVADLKVLVKKIGKDPDLARELYRTGNADAQYLAGLIAHGGDLSPAELREWAKKAAWQMVSEYTVAWMAAEHPKGWDVALGWIDSDREEISSCGWNALAGMVATRPDSELDLDGVKKLLARVSDEIHEAPNRTRYTMNGFVIAVGAAVAPLMKAALGVARGIGDVSVDMGETSCKLPPAAATIGKAVERSGPGKKRKSVKC